MRTFRETKKQHFMSKQCLIYKRILISKIKEAIGREASGGMDANEAIAVGQSARFRLRPQILESNTILSYMEEAIVDLIVNRVDVWAASTVDKPRGLSGILKGLYEAGADLDFIIARRTPEKPGEGVVFLTPIRGDKEVEAASTLGFNLTNSVAAVRVEGDNVPGAAAGLTELIADAGINVRGFSLAIIGPRYIAYIGFHSTDDADAAVTLIQGIA